MSEITCPSCGTEILLEVKGYQKTCHHEYANMGGCFYTKYDSVDSVGVVNGC